MIRSSLLARIVTVCLLLLAFAVALPLVVLAFYNHPSPTDDYCFANTAMRYGFWEAQQIYYDGWSGRFFHNFIVHSSPLTIGWLGGYKIYPIVLLFLLMLGFYLLADQWLYKSFGYLHKAALAAGLFIGYVATLGSLAEFLYWYSGMACYSLSGVLLPYLLATLLAHQRQGFGLEPAYLFAESLLISGIIGSSETSMVMAMSVLGLVAFGGLIVQRRISATIVILLIVGAIGCFYVIKAPGNAIRMGMNPNSANIPHTLLSALRYSITYLTHQLLQTPLLPFSLLYLPLAYQLTSQKPLPSFLRLSPYWALLHGVMTVFVLISLHFYGVGVPPARRIINITNLVFYLSWFYTLTLFVVDLRPRIPLDVWLRFARPVVLASLVWILVSVFRGPVLPVAYGDWLSGRAALYDQAMQQRYQQMMANTESSVILTPLACYPSSMYMEDVKNDPNYLWNRCWADYYHKKTIVLKGSPTQRAQ